MGLVDPATQEIPKPAGLRSRTALSLHAGGWLMLASMFLPVSEGCGSAAIYPLDDFVVESGMTLNHLILDSIILSVYGNSGLVAGWISLCAVFASRKLWLKMFYGHWIGSTLFAVALFAYEFPLGRGWSAAIQYGLWCCPPLIATLLWIGRAERSGDHELAWARLQHSWSCAAFLYVNAISLLHPVKLAGYWLSMSALVITTLSVQWARFRMQHDLWDPRIPVIRPQYSIQNLLIWMTLPPLVIAYYRSIEPFVHWMLAD